MNTMESPDRVKIAHLVTGLLFLGIVALATGLDTGILGWSAARYLWPTLLVAAGTIGLGAAYAANRRSKKPTD